MTELHINSTTHLVPAPDVEAGRRWYAELLGRDADLNPAPSVYEWRLHGSAWLQVAPGAVTADQSGQVLRLGVVDLAAAVERFVGLGGQLADRIEIEGVIAIQDVIDPFGNRLCFYEESEG